MKLSEMGDCLLAVPDTARAVRMCALPTQDFLTLDARLQTTKLCRALSLSSSDSPTRVFEGGVFRAAASGLVAITFRFATDCERRIGKWSPI